MAAARTVQGGSVRFARREGRTRPPPPHHVRQLIGARWTSVARALPLARGAYLTARAFLGRCSHVGLQPRPVLSRRPWCAARQRKELHGARGAALASARSLTRFPRRRSWVACGWFWGCSFARTSSKCGRCTGELPCLTPLFACCIGSLRRCSPDHVMAMCEEAYKRKQRVRGLPYKGKLPVRPRPRRRLATLSLFFAAAAGAAAARLACAGVRVRGRVHGRSLAAPCRAPVASRGR